MCTVTVTEGPAPANANGANHVVVATEAATLLGANIYNGSSDVGFLQVFDAAAIPAEDAVPLVILAMPAHSSARLDFGPRGRGFTTGIVLAGSSVAAEYEAVLGFVIDAQYI
jgi:hypothetical protein